MKIDKPGISALIGFIGDDKIEYQLLSASILKYKHSKKNKDVEITFVSSPHQIDTGKQAIIIWCDKGEFTKAVNKINEVACKLENKFNEHQEGE